MDSPELIDQLRKLWILDLVVRNEGFQQAALQAKVTRSAISQTVAQLEKQHGKVLLIRERAGIRPTEYCLDILRRARPILASLGGLTAPETPRAVPEMSWLDLGFYESLAIDVVPRLLQRLRRHNPEIRVQVRVARSGKLAAMVRKGELCMAIVTENDLLHGLRILPLIEDRLGLFVSRAVSDAESARLPLGTIAAGPDGVPRYLARFLKACGKTKACGFTSDSMEALLEAAVQGCVVAVLPARVAGKRAATLRELTPAELSTKDAGHHRICLIGRPNCDEEENDYLADEIRSLLAAGEVVT